MLTFGHSTLIDFLSWIVVLTLGIKLGATIILLSVDNVVRDRRGWGGIMWWSTKITPVIAVPCCIGIAWLEGEGSYVWAWLALMLFVIIAVPLKVRQRRARIAGRMSADPLPGN